MKTTTPHPQGFTYQKPSKKERNAETRRRSLPIDAWLADVGFTPEQITAMKAGAS